MSFHCFLKFLCTLIDKLYKGATNLCGRAMSESLLMNEIKFDGNVNLKDILNSLDIG